MNRKPKRMVKRLRFDAFGGEVTIRVYNDASAQVHVDHPSNDPVIEGMMAGVIFEKAAVAYRSLGLPTPVWGPIKWRSDPPEPRPAVVARRSTVD